MASNPITSIIALQLAWVCYCNCHSVSRGSSATAVLRTNVKLQHFHSIHIQNLRYYCENSYTVLKELNHLGLLCPMLKRQHAEVIWFYCSSETIPLESYSLLKRNDRSIVVDVTVSTNHKIK